MTEFLIISYVNVLFAEIFLDRLVYKFLWFNDYQNFCAVHTKMLQRTKISLTDHLVADLASVKNFCWYHYCCNNNNIQKSIVNIP